MRIIKRYPNRKLYDKQDKKYITLDQIADLIRSGYDVQVVDHATGEDLTALTLSQIIFEQEKRQSGFLPRSILTNLIQAGGDRINSFQRTFTSPRAFIQHVDDEIKRRIQSLIAQGEILEAEGERLIQKLVPQANGESNQNMADDEQIERII
ncbi:MAG: polyhydroxyalkanoate synthesis regulator DNA-binding domain-containing protein, partial [Anaerolineales bacterium]